MEEDISNPWSVENIEVFHLYCCPECEQKYQESQEFQQHALTEHPKGQLISECLFDFLNIPKNQQKRAHKIICKL